MKDFTIPADEALALCSRAEDHFFERKSHTLSGTKLQKIVVALANADGGEVLVGVADDNDEANSAERWRGFSKIEDFNGLLQAVHSLSPSVDVRYEFLRHAVLNTYAMRLYIERSADVNKTADGRVYQRFGARLCHWLLSR